MPLVGTKLHAPSATARVLDRPQLAARLDAVAPGVLVLVSAPAGFGKSTLVGHWSQTAGVRAAWLSLDAEDQAFTGFLTYVIAAIRKLEPDFATGLTSAITAGQALTVEAALPAFVNALAAVDRPLTLILDDYHEIDSAPVDQLLTALVEIAPPTLSLIVATREDPRLPLARWRTQGRLVELRAADLRFTPEEAAGLLNDRLGLGLDVGDIAALDARTEGWAAGLQLAAISLQGTRDTSGFIRSFTGSHRYVMDYLVEEVLHRLPEATQDFLLRTAFLDRFCASLCDAVLGAPPGTSETLLAAIERANLFIVPLDEERRWFRYHHLFAALLRQRREARVDGLAEARARASRWFEDQGLEAEAFHYAAASGDIDLTSRLVVGAGMPLHFKGLAPAVLAWLEALPAPALETHPALWVIWASADLFIGRLEGIEPKLRAAEDRFAEDDPDPQVRDLIGHIASIRATLAVSRHDSDEILAQSERALSFLDRHNLPVLAATCWAMGYAYQTRGDLAAAHQAYAESLSVAEAVGHGLIRLLSTLGLGACQEAWGEHDQAEATYDEVLRLAGDPALPVVAEAHLGLARIAQQRRDLAGARSAALRALPLARLMAGTDRAIAVEALLAQLRAADGDYDGAAAELDRLRQLAQARGFTTVLPDIETARAAIERTPVSQPADALLDQLSSRELEVLQLTARGLSNRDIGEKLFLAVSTVKGHQQRIFEKLHVKRRTEAIARARELGLIP